MTNVYRVTAPLRTPQGAFEVGALLTQAEVDTWPEVALVNRLRLGDLIPEVAPVSEPVEVPVVVPPTAEELAALTKAEIAALVKGRYDVELKEGNKESMIAEALAVIEKGTPTE